MRYLGLCLVLVMLPAGARAQPAGPSRPVRPEPEPIAAPREVPAPGMVVLSQKEYQELLERAERARGPDRATRPQTPSRCRITGRVGHDLATVTLEYEFRTHQARSRVALGCGQGFPTRAEVDGKPPSLTWGPEGLLAEVEDAGEHKLTVGLELPVEVRGGPGGEPALVLDLPAAPVTVVEDLRFPGSVRKVGGRLVLRDGPMGRQEVNQEFRTEAAGGEERWPQRLKTPGLGPVERLELSWQGPPAAGNAAPVLSLVRSQVVVRASETEVVTRAELSLGVRRGQSDRWQLVVPADAVVTVPAAEAARVAALEPPEGKGTLRTIRLKQPTSDPVSVEVEVRQPRGNLLTPIGPFLVVGAVPQQGQVVVTAAAGLTAMVQSRGESPYVVGQREPTEEEKRLYPGASAYRYGLQAAATPATGAPLFDLDISRVRPVVEARLAHTLTWEPPSGDEPAAWRVRTLVEANVLHTETDHLSLSFPLGYEYDEQAALQEASDWQGPDWQDKAKRQGTARLTPRRKGPVGLAFEGRVAGGPAGQRQATVPLPRLQGTVDRGGHTVTVVLPAEQEVMAAGGEAALDGSASEKPSRRVWKFDRMPGSLVVSWRPYRPEVAVDGKALVHVVGRQAHVRQMLWFAGPPPEGDAMPVRIPEGALGLRVTPPGGKAVVVGPTAAGIYDVRLAVRPDPVRPVVLEYTVWLPENVARPFPLPLAVPVQATRGEVRVFLWVPAGTRPEVASGPWQVRLEDGPEGEPYPSAVLAARQPNAPLTLRLPEGAGAAQSSLRVERVLVQATVEESGRQTYRARFLVAQAARSSLEIELPTPLFASGLPGPRLRYRGKEVIPQAVEEPGRPAGASRVARVELPSEILVRPGVLEVEYSVPPARAGVSSGVRSVLAAPVLRGDAGLAPVRWQVVLPARWQLLHIEGGYGDVTGWGRQGWLLAPRPVEDPADVEHWFAGPGEAAAPAGTGPALVCWGSAGAPLVLVHAPRRSWLLVCSLVVLTLGLVVLLAPLPRSFVWSLGTALGLGLVALGLTWPGLLTALAYGVQPGLWVLAPVACLQWYLHHRHRRRIVFLPSFRQSPGSSVVRPGAARGRTEPSTLDAPPVRPVPVFASGAEEEAVPAAGGGQAPAP